MKKNRIAIGLLCLCFLCMAGCAKVPDLSTEQNNQVAEYIASRLLKYDANYADPVLDYDDSVLEITPTPAPTRKPKDDDAKEEDEKTGQAASPAGGAGTAASTRSAVSADLSKLCGDGKYVVKPLGYEMVNKYKDVLGDVTALEGSKLLVVHFTVQNQKNKAVNADILSEQLNFHLDVAGDTITPLHTITSKDLQFFNVKIPAGKAKSAVLIFEVEKKSVAGEVTLIAEAGTQMARVSIQEK